ncbi:MAG: hypothetical protein ACTSQC_03920 [Candidatus Heimdallarchaeaceae archaeon]
MVNNDAPYSESFKVHDRFLVGVSDRDEEWHRLENAATGFSLISTPKIPQVFRLSATMKEIVNITQLQKALNNIIVRFPYFRVNMKNSFFWHFWETNLDYPKIYPDSKYPNNYLPITQKGEFPFRVKAYKKRIAIEYSHCLTDGTGGLTFMKALVAEYLSVRGIKSEDWGDILRPNQIPKLEEYEDAYRKYSQKVKTGREFLSNAFIIPFKREKVGIYHITKGIMPVKKVLEEAKNYGISITEYIVSNYIESLQELLYSFPANLLKKNLKPIRIMVPVNLRNLFSSKTMRNFSLYILPGIDPRLGRYNFDEIVRQVHHFMKKEVHTKAFISTMYKNTTIERRMFLRLTPLALKKFFGQRGYHYIGTTAYTGILTNLGRIKLPEEVEKHVEDVGFLPAQVPVNKVGAAMISYKDKLSINFGRIIKDPIVERFFFRNIAKKGISVKIETN